jgi:hypothetical protein
MLIYLVLVFQAHAQVIAAHWLPDNARRRVQERQALAARHSATPACTTAACTSGAKRAGLLRGASGSYEKGGHCKQYILGVETGGSWGRGSK